MIHIQNTSITSGAVMTSFWFKNVADKTISSSFVVWIIQKKALEVLN